MANSISFASSLPGKKPKRMFSIQTAKDLLALPVHEMEERQVKRNPYVPPANPVEEKLQEIWQGILQVEQVGMKDEFIQLGGNSLDATALVSKIHKEFAVKVPLDNIFKLSTIRQLSLYIESSHQERFFSIEPVEEREYYELSSAQKRMYLLQRMDWETTTYNMPIVKVFEDPIDKLTLEKAVKKLVARHESLRTSFIMVNREPVQRVLEKEIHFKISSDNAAGETAREIMQRFVKPFDLNCVPLIRVGLVRVPGNRDILLVDMHHIISDGVSLGLLTRDFLSLYNGEEIPLLRVQYKDFAHWQKGRLQQETIKKLESYWLDQLQGEIPALNLPLDYTRPVIRSFQGDRVCFELTGREITSLKKLAGEQEVTLYMLLLAMFAVLLSKLGGQEDIVVGTGSAGRRHEDLNHIIGMFVNTLAIRTQPQPDRPFIDFLSQIKEKTLQAFENQEYPFETLVEKIVVTRDTSRNPVFDVVFALQNQDLPSKHIIGREITAEEPPEFYNHQAAKFDITLQGIETPEKLQFYLEYCTRLFKKDTIEGFIRYFKQIAVAVVKDSRQQLGEIEIITAEEKQWVLVQFNDTAVDYPREQTIDQLFEEQAHKQPDKLAVVYEHQSISFRRLNKQADRVAAYLQSLDAKREEAIGIMAVHSIAMIVGILGILKAGCAYLPINVEYPVKRKKYLLKDAGAKILLTGCRDTGGLLPGIVRLEDPAIYTGSGMPAKNHRYNHLAYIIYTSGSTGNPRGVMVVHRNVVRLVKNTNFVEFREGDRILQTGALEFDASTFEIWGALLNGLSLFLTDKAAVLEPAKLKQTIRTRGIATMWLTSSLFNRITDMDVEVFSGISNLLVGGDVLSPVHINRVRERFPGLTVINGYGPTENTTFSVTHYIDREYKERIPIGKPIANSTAYIVDCNYRLQPIGVPGNLCIGGDGVSRGYLNNPELTAERFIPGFYRSYMSYRSYISKTIYQTGDLACWLPGGIIRFLGRRDHQIKIRGYRVELGEIETRFLAHRQINEAVVIDRVNPANEADDRYLCAYIVSKPGNLLPSESLRDYLAEDLPTYMIPSYFVQLEKLPLTSNGKIDRKSLPVQGIKAGPGYIAPKTGIEKKLVEIYSEILNLEPGVISIDSDFFQLGGHSVKVMDLTAKIHKELDVKVPISEFFIKPTVRELSKYIAHAGVDKFKSVECSEKKEYYALSSAQKRMYIVQYLESIEYNVPQIIPLNINSTKEKLENAFKELIKRHESLRTSIEMVGHQPVQRVHDRVGFTLECYDLPVITHSPAQGLPATVIGEINKIIAGFVRPFDLSRAPWLRAAIIELGEWGNLCLVDMHHVIADMTARNILKDEFLALYDNEELPRARLQYKDYAEWQNRAQYKASIKNKETYWLNRFKGDVPVLNLPTDYPRENLTSFEGEILQIEIEPGLTGKIIKRVSETDTTLYIFMMAAYFILLAKYTGQEDIVMASPVSKRTHADLQSIIGMFANLVAMRNFPNNNKTFREFLEEVKINAINAYDNQEYPIEELIKKLNIRAGVNRNSILEVVFALLDPAANEPLDRLNRQEVPGLTLNSDFHLPKISKFNLSLIVYEKGNKIVLLFDYRRHLFKKQTIEIVGKHLINILGEVVENPELKIYEIEMFARENQSIEVPETPGTIEANFDF